MEEGEDDDEEDEVEEEEEEEEEAAAAAAGVELASADMATKKKTDTQHKRARESTESQGNCDDGESTEGSWRCSETHELHASACQDRKAHV